MNFYQRVLISAHSKAYKAGWFSSRHGFFMYSVVYFFYKRHLEGRQLIRQLEYLRESGSGFSSVSLIIDVGAHIGFFTKEALRIFPLTRIIAVEPPGENSAGFQVLNRKKIAQGLVQFKNAAAWSFNGEIPFHFESSNTANNRFDSSSTTKVPCITLDSIPIHGTPTVLILKIDVQGFEFEVLEGAVEMLEGIKSHCS